MTHKIKFFIAALLLTCASHAQATCLRFYDEAVNPTITVLNAITPGTYYDTTPRYEQLQRAKAAIKEVEANDLNGETFRELYVNFISHSSPEGATYSYLTDFTPERFMKSMQELNNNELICKHFDNKTGPQYFLNGFYELDLALLHLVPTTQAFQGVAYKVDVCNQRESYYHRKYEEEHNPTGSVYVNGTLKYQLARDKFVKENVGDCQPRL